MMMKMKKKTSSEKRKIVTGEKVKYKDVYFDEK